MSRYYIGFDCGTQSAKTALYDQDFACIAETSVASSISFPKPNWAEIDLESYLDGVREGIKTCVEESGIDPHDIVAISGSGIIAGVGGVDASFNPVTPYIPFLDGRALDEWTAVMSECEPLWGAETGNVIVAPYQPPFAIRWMQKNVEGFDSKVAKLVNNGPFVLARLAGLSVEDAFIDQVTIGGWGLGYFLSTKEWSDAQIKEVGLPKDKLPRIVKPWDQIGVLSEEEAEKIGIPAGIKIYAGAGDTMQSCLGSGLTDPGIAVDVAGTAAMIATLVKTEDPDGLARFPLFSLAVGPIENSYFYGAYLQVGGIALSWFKNNVCHGDDSFYDAINEEALSVPPGANGIIFIPNLVGSFANLSGATGSFLNLNASHTRADMWKAILESIAFEYLTAFDAFTMCGIPINKMVVTEGGSKSDVWNQIKADMLGIEVVTPAREQGAVLANAVLAAYGAGDIESIEDTINSLFEIKKHFYPNAENTALYRSIYEKRGEVVGGPMLEVFNELNNTYSTEV